MSDTPTAGEQQDGEGSTVGTYQSVGELARNERIADSKQSYDARMVYTTDKGIAYSTDKCPEHGCLTFYSQRLSKYRCPRCRDAQ